MRDSSPFREEFRLKRMRNYRNKIPALGTKNWVMGIHQ